VDREVVCALVLRHQLPFFAVENDDGERRSVLASCGSPLRWLAAVNEADGLGRVCDDPARIAENVALFRVMAEELGCLDGPYPFANGTARFRYARGEGTRHDVPPEVFDGECIVMSGLPGAGKDTWIQDHHPDTPMVSLDALRAELGIDPREPQGPVAAAGRERAREHLRKGRTFVWNATNLTRQHRQRIVDLAADYRYRVTLVQVEAPSDRLWAQNRRRDDAVPEVVIDKLLRKWQFAEPVEAHEVRHVRG
jgi:predicted kinase